MEGGGSQAPMPAAVPESKRSGKLLYLRIFVLNRHAGMLNQLVQPQQCNAGVWNVFHELHFGS